MFPTMIQRCRLTKKMKKSATKRPQPNSKIPAKRRIRLKSKETKMANHRYSVAPNAAEDLIRFVDKFS
jgi:hypothetical protein